MNENTALAITADESGRIFARVLNPVNIDFRLDQLRIGGLVKVFDKVFIIMLIELTHIA